jgi:hypothetical protein
MSKYETLKLLAAARICKLISPAPVTDTSLKMAEGLVDILVLALKEGLKEEAENDSGH